MLNTKVLQIIEKRLNQGYAANQIAAYLLIFLCPKELPPQITVDDLTLQIESIKNYIENENTAKRADKQGNV